MQCERLRWAAGSGWCTEGAAMDRSATLVLAFSTLNAEDSEEMCADLRVRHPLAVLAACSTATTAMGAEVSDEGAVAVAVHLAHTQVSAQRAVVLRPEDSFEAGLGMGRSFRTDDLVLVLLLSDGLNVNGSRLIEGLSAGLGGSVLIAGGLAGDGARFVQTWTALDGEPQAHQVVAVGFHGRHLRVSAAAVGGWDPFGPRRGVTRSCGPVLHELDGAPALDLYEKYLGDEAVELPGSALRYPLQIWPPGEPERAVVRTVLGVDARTRSMTFAGDMPQGWNAQLMRGHHTRLVDGAEQAARLTSQDLLAQGHREDEHALALLVSCAGRRLVMHQRTGEEVDAVQQVLGAGVTTLGFYSHGEMAPVRRGGPCDLHNETMSVTLLSEAFEGAGS